MMSPALLLLAASSLSAPPDAPPVAPAQTIRARLATPVTLALREQSLRAAVDALGKAAGVNIALDSTAIQQQLGFSPDQPSAPANIDLKDVPLRVALRRVLDPYGLTYAVVGDTVFVSTEEGAAERQLRQHVSVDFDGVELAAALPQIAHDAGVNLALDPRAGNEGAARVTLRLEDVQLDTAVRLLAAMAGLERVRVGNVLFITTKAVAQELLQEAPASRPNDRVEKLLELSGTLPVPPPVVAPVPPPGVPPAVPPAEGGDRR